MAQNRYERMIERIFFAHYQPGRKQIEFEREELERVAQELAIKLPKNLGDIIYSFKFRAELPARVQETAEPGKEWSLQQAGRARYRFPEVIQRSLTPSALLVETKVPDATPGIIVKYALNDEQALLAKLRYNRLID